MAVQDKWYRWRWENGTGVTLMNLVDGSVGFSLNLLKRMAGGLVGRGIYVYHLSLPPFLNMCAKMKCVNYKRVEEVLCSLRIF